MRSSAPLRPGVVSPSATRISLRRRTRVLRWSELPALLFGHVLLGVGKVVLEVVRQVAKAREHLAEGLVAVTGLAHLARRVGPLKLTARLHKGHLATHDLDGLHHRVDDAHLGGLGLAARAQIGPQVHREVGEVEHEQRPRSQAR